MTWGTHCPQCGTEGCGWMRGPVCEGNVKQKARQTLAELDEVDIGEHAYWQRANEMLGLEQGTVESLIVEDPEFFNASSKNSIDESSAPRDGDCTETHWRTR